MKYKKLLLTSGAIASIAAPIAAVVSCGTKEDDDTSKIKLAYEASWSKAIQNALKTLAPEERAKIKLVEVENGKSVDYLDQVKNKPTDPNTADVFAFAADHSSSLKDGGVLLSFTPEEYVEADYSDNTMTKAGDVYFGFPLNTESVVQIYHKKEVADGYDTIENAFKDDKFITQWANLWHASTYMNSAMIGAGEDVSDAASNWITGAKGSYKYPFVTDQKFETAFKALWTENNKLRASTADKDTWKVNIANNANRDSELKSHFISGDINGMIDGPWIINDLIARAVKAGGTEQEIATKISDIGIKKLPTLAGNKMRHFRGGWAYGVNRQKLAKSSGEELTTKKALEIKLIKAITSNARANDWFSSGAKISAASGQTKITVTADDVKAMKLEDPTVKDTYLDMSKFGDTLATQIADLYQRVIAGVSSQSNDNVAQPSGSAWNLWESWDKNNLSAPVIKSADQAWTKFKADADKVLTEANK